MLNQLKTLFRAPSAETIALRELEAAKRDLLRMQDAQEYAARMVEYHQGKIRRLTTYLKTSVEG
jgi:hypothetical protein